MADYLLHQYLAALAGTLALELGVAIVLGLWSPRQLRAVVLVNLATHPTLHAVLWTTGWSQPGAIVALEVVVFAAEGLMLRRLLRLTAGRAMLLSAAMNGASALVGLTLTF
jgi:hypothetical protein